MTHKNVLKARWAAVSAAALVFSTPALAGKDLLYPSSETTTAGSDGATTLTGVRYPGDAVSVTATWSIQDRSHQAGQDTAYPIADVTFRTETTVTPAAGADVAVAPIAPCTFESRAATCTSQIEFTAPSTPGNYQLWIEPQSGGSSGFAVKTLYVNFTVAAPLAQQLESELTVAKQCVLLNAGEIPLSAALQERASADAIAGADIDFYLDPELDAAGAPIVPAIGSATTDAAGVAAFTLDVNGLGVGDYSLYGEFDGDASHKASNDSDTLGISYVFAGFRQPINADGTSIFGGRVIPIKIKLVDANGASVTDALPAVWLKSYGKDLGLGVDVEAASSVSSADTTNYMRYAPEEQQYIYNWDATNLSNGTYEVVVDLGDSAACSNGPHSAIITVAKKGKK